MHIKQLQIGMNSAVTTQLLPHSKSLQASPLVVICQKKDF